MDRRKNTKRFALAGAIVAASVLTALLLLRPRTPPAPRSDTAPVADAAERGRRAAAALLESSRQNAAAPPRKVAHDILKEYPPNSRPVTQARAEAFKYNHRVVQFLGATGPKKAGPPAFYSAFTADKLNVFAGETITLTLRAAQAPNSAAENYPITILGAGLTKGRAPDAPKVADVAFADDGRNGDGRRGDGTYGATIDPSRIQALADYHGSVRAFVQFVANGTTFGAQLFFEHFPPQGIAATFTGHFREAIEEGSLVVYAAMDVRQAGNFALDATLLTTDEQAFCHSRFKGKLAVGTQEARFLFFGKAIRDGLPAGGASPFKVSELYGLMVPDPARLVELSRDKSFAPAAVPLFGGQYVTSSYDIEQFSEASWRGRGS